MSNVELANPTSLVGKLDIGEDCSLLTVRAFIYRGDAIAFDFETNMFGANQVISVQGVAEFNGKVFVSNALIPKQRGASSVELYPVVITVSSVEKLDDNEAFVEGEWGLMTINGAKPQETFIFSGELSRRV
jgi:hypothetical protein